MDTDALAGAIGLAMRRWGCEILQRCKASVDIVYGVRAKERKKTCSQVTRL